MATMTRFERDSMYLGRFMALIVTALIWYVGLRHYSPWAQLGDVFGIYVITTTIMAGLIHWVRVEGLHKKQFKQLTNKRTTD